LSRLWDASGKDCPLRNDDESIDRPSLELEAVWSCVSVCVDLVCRPEAAPGDRHGTDSAEDQEGAGAYDCQFVVGDLSRHAASKCRNAGESRSG